MANTKKKFEHSFKPEKKNRAKQKGKQTLPCMGWKKKILQRLEPKKRYLTEKKMPNLLKYLMVHPLSPLRPLQKKKPVFVKLILQQKFEKISPNRPFYTVNRLLKLVSQRSCTQVSAESFSMPCDQRV